MPNLTQTAEMIVTDIDCQVVKRSQQEHRHHLGASEIGDECMRKLWYKFRWVKLQRFPGRMLRVFDRGNREEATFARLLARAGWLVEDRDLATGEQFCFTACEGHFGGSMDGLATPPAGSYEWLGRCVVEFKTSNSKSWRELSAQGVATKHPRHYAQMQLYGAHANVQYAVYLSVNKDTDELYCEVVPIDRAFANDLLLKAELIISTREAPPKINDDPTWYQCKYCDFVQQCHHNAAAERNCRSCAHSAPAEAGTWLCTKHARLVPQDKLAQEYPCWESLI